MEVEEPRGPDIPVTILTGFLGAGKTTLLNRILTENHNHRIAIIENEFGQENIDTELIVQSDKEQIISMNNGCVCCTIRGDLSRVLTDLRQSSSKRRVWPIPVRWPRPSSWTTPWRPSIVSTAS